MTRTTLVAALGVLLAPGLRADQQPAPPHGPQPVLCSAHLNKEGRIVISQVKMTWVPFENTTNMKIVVPHKEADLVFNRAQVQVLGTDGKPIDPRTWSDRLRKEVVVLVSANGKMIDPFYLEAIRKDTLILLVPPNVITPAPEWK